MNAPDFPDGGLAAGKRIAISGRSGSGKTYLTKWIVLKTLYMRWIVMDSKHDPEYDSWAPIQGLPPMQRLHKEWQNQPRIVIRPRPQEMHPMTLDAYLGDLHDGFNNFGAVIDEVYHTALNGRAGPGLTGLVTRGRVRRQSVIMGAQRPALVPLFVYSESNGYVIMSLNLKADRKRLFENTGQPIVMNRIEPRHWLYYDVADDRLRSFKPVTIEKVVDKG